MRWRRRRADTPTGQIRPYATGEATPCACAVCRAVLGATSSVPYPRSPVPTSPNGRPQTPTGDTYNDLMMVLAIAGAFGLILAVEVLAFVYFAFDGTL